ncbi:MAG: CHASE2 domain-containing protein [Erythrobacter sp.]
MSKSKPEELTAARRLAVAAVLIGALVGILITAFTGESQRRFVFDNWQRLDSREVETDAVAVVLIDNDSIAKYGEWPWSRLRMAQLIDAIGAAEPAAIGIDIYFTDRNPLRPEAFAGYFTDEELDEATRARVLSLPDMDTALAGVLGATPSVMARVAIPAAGANASELFYTEVAGTPPPGLLRSERVLASHTDLDAAALSQAFVNGPPDGDGVLRRVPLSVQAGEAVAPGFALELARIASGVETAQWNGTLLKLGDRAIQSDANADMQFKMGKMPREATHPAFEVLDGDVGRTELKGKIVVVGVGAAGTYDVVATPIASEVLGPIVQAQAANAILKGDWLSRPPAVTWVEIAAALALIALLIGAALTFHNAFLIPAAIIGLALPVGSFFAYASANLLFDPARPLVVGLCAAIGLLLARYALALAELVEQRIRAAEQKKENEAARDIQMSMVPSASTLSRLDPRTEIGAVLEPAKSVGGDFFDAIKIGEDRLLFLVGDVSGKGMPAALFMALSKMLAKSNLARAGDGLEKAVASLNHELMEEADEEMGLTMLIGLVTCSTGALQLVNAGHENPMVVHADGSVETLAMVGGPPFCVIEFPYPAEEYRLGIGDTLIVITDGATEAFNEKDAQFGLDGVTGALKSMEGASAVARASHLARQVRLFEGASDATDDLTIFAIRYVGEEGAA